MDEALLARLLAPRFLQEQLAQRMDLAGARLVSATPRDIDAPGYLSDLTGVTLAWSGETQAPTAAVLKVSHPKFGVGELPFYQDIAPLLQCPVIPGYFAGGLDAQTQRVWLLMEDLTASHEQPSDAPVPPTLARCEQLVAALARFHAAGWNKTGLPATASSLDERLRKSEWVQPNAERLFAQAGDALAGGTRALYADFVAALPALAETVARIPARTVAHGDAHVWNLMLPREGPPRLPRLIDWDGWHVGLGAWDLAYMMAVHWDRDLRQRFEMRLLDVYQRALAEAGVTGYSRDALQADYRLAVLLHLRTPISRFTLGMSPYVWWPQLARIQQAVEDLGCRELLSQAAPRMTGR